MKIRAVIFDFGGVLCFHPERETIARAAERCGVEYETFVRAMWKDRLRYDAGEEPGDYWRGVAATAGTSFDDGLIAEMIEREIEFWSRYDERVFEWVDRLRASGIRTGILSNLPRPLGERLRETEGFLEHFDQVTFSYELRLVKPQKEIYDHAVRGVGVAAGESLFLDDRTENIEGARAAGLQAELFTKWEEFVRETPKKWELPAPRS
ncbi:MAG TPA: HAD family phosphatase [Bryobacteraceae bacterium]|nr:HAD family phosphatase [Bryobacteraceae bacterium]